MIGAGAAYIRSLPPGRSRSITTVNQGDERDGSEHMARHEIPEPAPRAEIPTNALLVFSKGAGVREFETAYGIRETFGVHVYQWNGTGVDHLGHVNVFWEAVRDQLSQALQGDDDLMAAQVVKDGRRYILRAWGNAIETKKAYDATEAQLTEPDAPYVDDAAPF